MNNFLLGKKYNVKYWFLVKGYKQGKKITIKQVLSSLNLMYCRQTCCFYIFWTGSNYFKLKKSNLIEAIEV